MKIFPYILLFILCLLLTPAIPASTSESLTAEALRKKSTKELVQYAEEAFQEVQGANLKFMAAVQQKEATEAALLQAHQNYDTMYSWALSENTRANNSSTELWREQQKHKAALQKLFLYRCITSALAFIVAFVLVIQVTQYLMPPYSVGIPLAVAVAASAGVWIFL